MKKHNSNLDEFNDLIISKEKMNAKDIISSYIKNNKKLFALCKPNILSKSILIEFSRYCAIRAIKYKDTASKKEKKLNTLAENAKNYAIEAGFPLSDYWDMAFRAAKCAKKSAFILGGKKNEIAEINAQIEYLKYKIEEETNNE